MLKNKLEASDICRKYSKWLEFKRMVKFIWQVQNIIQYISSKLMKAIAEPLKMAEFLSGYGTQKHQIQIVDKEIIVWCGWSAW